MAERYFQPHDWLVVEETFTPEQQALNATVFALGNGYMGVRGTPEEGCAVQGASGTYLPLMYDAGRIGYEWTRVNFPTRATFVVTSADWTPIFLTVNGTRFDPQTGTLREYRRALNLQDGTLTRRAVWEDADGRQTAIESCRIACQHAPHLGAIRYTFTPLNYSGEAVVECGLDARICPNLTDVTADEVARGGAVLSGVTTQTGFKEVMAMRARLTANGAPVKMLTGVVLEERYIARTFTLPVQQGVAYTVDKIVAVTTSRDREAGDPLARATELARKTQIEGFEKLLTRHVAAWAKIWADHDIVIDGDPLAQQGIHYSVSNLEWNYSGDDPRLNVGAKGISGPGYGGLYFWDSEVYMLPYYTYTNPAKARNLLMQRYITLDQARERARKFGYQGAFYPWTTLDGTDCGTPWEYDMLEQHISVAIPYGVWHYVEASGDDAFLRDHGAEMVIECSRFWASRVVFNARRGRYVINAVTGPDEYAMVVNNNCYTNTMVQFTLEYALQTIEQLRQTAPKAWADLAERLDFRDEELQQWATIAARMYLPFDRKMGIHAQDDAFLDMDPIDVAAIPAAERPLLGNWPWERIIRHQVLKQPDVVLMDFLLNDRVPERVKRADYDYYEPKCIHDSSLSVCIHSIMATELGYTEQAFDYYLRSSRLDLDNVNGNADQGIHIACMAGTWMAIVNGFAGMRLTRGKLSFTPHLPEGWQRLAFTIQFRGRSIGVTLTADEIAFTLQGRPTTILVAGRRVRLIGTRPAVVSTNSPVRV